MDKYLLQIETNEGITFKQKIASPVIRSLAWGIDLSIVIIIIIGLLQISSPLPFLNQILPYFIGFLTPILYPIICEWKMKGQTLGKKALALRVIDENGLKLKFSQIAIRNLLRVVDFLPLGYLFGGIFALITPKGQRLGDFIATTVVVHIPKPDKIDISAIPSNKFNSLKPFPHLTARLRKKITPQEASIAFRAILRRNNINSKARIKLFKELAEHFQKLVKFPPEAYENCSNEQYINNILEILYTKNR